MASNYPYSYQAQPHSQPLMSSRPDSNPPQNNKSSLKVILLLVGVFVVALITIVCAIMLQKDSMEVTAPIKFGNTEAISGLSLISEYKDALLFSTFSSDGKHLAYATMYQTVKVLEIESHTLIAQFDLDISQGDFVVGVSFIHDDKALVLATLAGSLQVWNLETKSRVSRTTIDGLILGFEITNDFKHAVVTCLYRVKIWSFDEEQIISSISLSGVLENTALSPDNKYISGTDVSGNLYLWDFSTGNLITQLGSEIYSSTCYTHDSKYLVAVGNGLISIWNLETKTEVVNISNEDEIYDVEITRNNKYVAVGTDDGVKIYETETGAVAGYYLSGDRVHALSISRENRYMFASGDDEHLELINLETNASKTGFEINEPLIFQALNKHQKYMIGIDGQADIYLWKVVT